MSTGGKIALVALALLVTGGVATYFVYMELSKEPELSFGSVDPKTRSVTITIGKKQFQYKYQPSVLYLGKVSPFHTAEVVSYTPVNSDEATRVDIKIMKKGKLTQTKTVYLG